MTDRITTSEVLELARYGRHTLWKRIRQGRFPKPVDRGRENLWSRADVEKALGLSTEDVKDEAENPFRAAIHALPDR